MYKYCSTAQTRLDLGKGRTKTIDDDKFHNTDAYMRTKSTGSVYRKFLEDPDGIAKKGSGFKSAA